MRMDDPLKKALDMVRDEREYQDAKWGPQQHSPVMWLAILSEEVGEVAGAALRHHWDDVSPDEYVRELIQVAAVAVAAVECALMGQFSQVTAPGDMPLQTSGGDE